MSRSREIEGLGAGEEVTEEEMGSDHATSFTQCGVGCHREDNLAVV